MHCKQRIRISIDLEDFYQDYCRKIGIKFSGFSAKRFSGFEEKVISLFQKNKMTIFVTGILAENYPELIAYLAKQGHEIACHYYNHDACNLHSLKVFEKNLLKAKEIIQNASNTSCIGFRAPMFSLTTNNKKHFEVLDKSFKYDSSLNLDFSDSICNVKRQLGISQLNLLPVYKFSYYTFNFKPGGTYLKVFPVNSLRAYLNTCYEYNQDVILYIHPYEMIDASNFRISLKEIANQVGFLKGSYHYFRQFQWCGPGNRKIQRTIAALNLPQGECMRLDKYLEESYGPGYS